MTASSSSESIAAVLADLEREVASRDADYAKTHRFTPGEKITAEALDASEAKLGVKYPPSFRDFVLEHGLFSLGARDGGSSWIFVTWPLAEHRTALARLAEEELECEADVDEVAEQLGCEPEAIAVMKDIVLVGCEGHEDFIGFDLRTRNEETGECSFTLCLQDDVESSALAEEESTPCEGRGFDRWLASHIERRGKS
ncbi:MAG TPA: SMI1/KNR4 family protein [Polyangiaceae bacterium]